MGHNNTIGLVGATFELAQLFNSVGYQVVGGPDFTRAAKEIGELVEIPAMVIVVDQQAPGFGPWVEQQARKTPLRIIPAPGGSFSEHELALTLPATPEEVLGQFGFPATGARTRELIGFGGTVGEAAAPLPPAAPAPAPAPELTPPQPAGDPDFVAEPIPTLDDSEPLTPRAAPVSVPSGSGGEAPSRPQWLNETTPQPPQAAVEAPSRNPGLPTPPGHGRPETDPAPAPQHHGSLQHPHQSQEQRSTIPDSWSQPSAARLPWQAPEREAVAPQQQIRDAQFSGPLTAPQAQPLWSGHADFPGQPQPAPRWNEPAPPQPAPPQTYAGAQQPETLPAAQHPQQSIRDFRDSRSAFLQQSFQATRDAEVLICWAGKGGVGKTSMTVTSAQTAGEAGLRVLVIDANRGQSSIRKNLRVDGLPTIYEAAQLGISGVVIPKEELMRRRPAARGPVHFDVILAPSKDHAGSQHTPASHYASAVAELRQSYDLIVIDTQILEAEGDMSDVWAEFLVPLFRGGAWGLGIFDESASGLEELDERLTMLVGEFGISNGRMLAVSNMWQTFTDDDAAHVAQMLVGRATLIGSIDDDTAFADQLSAGFFPTGSTGVAPVIRQVLHQITGRPEFQLVERTTPRVSRLFRRRNKR